MKVTGPGSFSLEGLGAWARTFAASVSQGWRVEHDDNGSHVFPEVTFAPTLTFGLNAVGLTYASHGRYTRIGDIVHATFRITLSAVGSSTGTARIAGFPLAPDVPNGGPHPSAIFSYATGMAGLTSQPSAWMNNVPQLTLYDWGATGSAALDDTNFTATSDLIGHVTYRVG